MQGFEAEKVVNGNTFEIYNLPNQLGEGHPRPQLTGLTSLWCSQLAMPLRAASAWSIRDHQHVSVEGLGKEDAAERGQLLFPSGTSCQKYSGPTLGQKYSCGEEEEEEGKGWERKWETEGAEEDRGGRRRKHGGSLSLLWNNP